MSAPSRHVAPDLAAMLSQLGLACGLAAPLQTYLLELQKWNRAYNLTAIRDPDEMLTRHVADSLAVLPHLAAGFSDGPLRLLDVGSGGGMPGLLLAIARPDLQVTLLDSNGKKTRFLRHAVRTLSLANVDVAQARVEDWQAPQAFDRIISRAFADLSDFLGMSAHLLAPDGRWLAMKGKVADSETGSLPAGLSIEAIHPLEVPGLQEARSLIVVRRT